MDLIAEGIRQMLIRFEDDRKYMVQVHQDKRRNYWNPEAIVQAEAFLHLHLTCKYPVERMRQFVPVQMGSPLTSGESLHAHVARRFPDDVLPESEFIDTVQRTRRTGRFLLLMVGDGIRGGVGRMLDHLHDHPQRLFAFGLVEIGVRENPEVFSGRILLPSLVAKSTEIVRAVVRVEATGQANVSVVTAPHEAEEAAGYQRRTLSEEEFFQELPDERTRALYGRLFRLAEDLGTGKTWRSSAASLRLPDSNGSSRDITLLVLNTRGRVNVGWMAQGLRHPGWPDSIATDYVNSLCRIFQDVQPHARLFDTLTRQLAVEEVEGHFDEPADAVRQVFDAINTASGRSQEPSRRA